MEGRESDRCAEEALPRLIRRQVCKWFAIQSGERRPSGGGLYGKFIQGGEEAAISPIHAPIPVIPYIFTRVSHRRARVIYANTRERRKTRENLSSLHRGSSIRAVGDGLSLAIACLHGELIYAHQPVSMFARTISLHGTRARVTFAPTVISQISSRAAYTNSKSGI